MRNGVCVISIREEHSWSFALAQAEVYALKLRELRAWKRLKTVACLRRARRGCPIRATIRLGARTRADELCANHGVPKALQKRIEIV